MIEHHSSNRDDNSYESTGRPTIEEFYDIMHDRVEKCNEPADPEDV